MLHQLENASGMDFIIQPEAAVFQHRGGEIFFPEGFGEFLNFCFEFFFGKFCEFCAVFRENLFQALMREITDILGSQADFLRCVQAQTVSTEISERTVIELFHAGR